MAKYKNYRYTPVPQGKRPDPPALEVKKKAITKVLDSINYNNTDQTNEFIRVKVLLNELNKRMRKKPVKDMVKVVNYWMADV
jgi:hypothetical protein